MLIVGAAPFASLAETAPTPDPVTGLIPTEQAIERLEQRIKQKPKDFLLRTMLGQLHVRRAQETGNLDAYKRAKAAFEAALAAFPDYVPAMGELAGVQMSLHRFSEARELARKTLAKDRASSAGVAALGDAELALGNFEAAAKAFDQLPDGPDVWARRAELARIRGDNEEAIRLLPRAADAAEKRGEAPENLCWYRVRAGETFFQVGKFEEADQQYRAALKHWPQSYAAAEHMAELRGAQRKFDEAIALYQKLLARTPRPDLQQALGDLYVFMGKPDQAKPWIEKARTGYLNSVERGEVHYFHHLASFFADVREEPAEAVKYARLDLKLRQTPAAHEALAWAFFRAGEFAQAATEIKLTLVPRGANAHVYYHASLILSAAGELEAGQKYLRETFALNPHYDAFHVHR